MVAIFYYSVTFFKSAGIKGSEAQLANLGVGAIMVGMTLVTIPLMDRLGRRVLHLLGLVGMCLMAVLIVIAQNLEIGEFMIAATLIFVVFFALGPGSIPWMIAGEMFTQSSRYRYYFFHEHFSIILLKYFPGRPPALWWSSLTGPPTCSSA